MKRYLAIDIGASSGRHIAGWLEDGRLVTEEVYRFANANERENGHLVWNVSRLFEEVKNGIATAFKKYGEIESLSIDTWAVDYVLMNGDKEILPCYAYRDDRTAQPISKVHEIIPFQKLYAKTGIQYQPFNTIYQLYADKCAGRLEKATDYLMIPEYLIYKLTGVKATEYTNATATGLVNAKMHDFDREIIETLGLDTIAYGKLRQPGFFVGRLSDSVSKEVGGNTNVVLCATHDTASAVLAAPIEGEVPYISSGTWSLLGIEQSEAHTDTESMSYNFSNEGSVNFTFRYQKNIMGLWMIQSVRKELGNISFAEMEKMARESKTDALVDCNDECFLAPQSMCAAVREKAGEELDDGQLIRCIYRSLAQCYKQAISEMSQKLGKTFDTLHIIGGGSKDGFLNQLTAKATGLKVVAGPAEATSIGNFLVQMVASNECKDIAEGRKIIKNSFPLNVFGE